MHAAPAPSHRERKRRERTVLPPTRLANPLGVSFQVSLHTVPRFLSTACQSVFPRLGAQIAMEDNDNAASHIRRRQVLCAPSFHKAAFDIMERNRNTERERERVFARFVRFARAFKARLQRRDSLAFVEFVDLHGHASDTSGGHPAMFDEVMSAKALCGYTLTTCSGMTMVDHPEFGYRDLAVHSIILFADHLMAAAVLKGMLANDASLDGVISADPPYALLDDERDDLVRSTTASSKVSVGDKLSETEEESAATAQAAKFVATAKLACGEGNESFEAFRELRATASGAGLG